MRRSLSKSLTASGRASSRFVRYQRLVRLFHAVPVGEVILGFDLLKIVEEAADVDHGRRADRGRVVVSRNSLGETTRMMSRCDFGRSAASRRRTTIGGRKEERTSSYNKLFFANHISYVQVCSVTG